MKMEHKHYHKRSKHLAEPRRLTSSLTATMVSNQIQSEAMVYQRANTFLSELRKHKELPRKQFYELRRMALHGDVQGAYDQLKGILLG